jgi:RNA polymerase sigma-70 factor, ECF subfamily
LKDVTLTVTAKHTGLPEADAAVIEQSWARPERFAVIFERYFAPVHQYLARRVGDRAADDLAAEVFVAAFAQRQRYDLARDCARPWLYGIATNMSGTHRRQEQRLHHPLARSAAPEPSPSEEDRVTDRVSAAAAGPALAAALAELDTGDRTCCCSWPWRAWTTRRSPRHSASLTARCAPG